MSHVAAALAFAIVPFLAPVSIAKAQSLGSTVINPVTGATEIVVGIDPDNPGKVLTDADNAIITNPPAVGSTLVDDGYTWTVKSLTTGTYGVEAIVYERPGDQPGDPPVERIDQTVINATADLQAAAAAAGGAPETPAGQMPVADANVIDQRLYGSQGRGGSNAYGVRICFGIFGCIRIQFGGSAGRPGGPGPAVDRTVTVANWGNITTISQRLPGISVGSFGGNGGRGGDGYGAGISAYPGGAAGFGGSVTLNSSVSITTSGAFAHGIRAQSQGGRGGDGGTGYGISVSGGTGGPASAGGPVNVTSSGNITTYGNGAIGIFAQSIGGNGGTGGSSYGLVGDASQGSTGGNGSTVIVTNSGSITTFGQDAHGILAQSIGGSGGNSGDAVGIVAFGGGAGAGGGFGSAVTVNNLTGGVIRTEGNAAFGIFAQSIGGGGGAGGFAAGLAGFGGSGSAGGNAGSVSVTTQTDSSITTLGTGSHAIYAQSVGGGVEPAARARARSRSVAAEVQREMAATSPSRTPGRSAPRATTLAASWPSR